MCLSNFFSVIVAKFPTRTPRRAPASPNRLRQRYGELFAEEIAQTVDHPEEVDDEIRHLLSVLEER